MQGSGRDKPFVVWIYEDITGGGTARLQDIPGSLAAEGSAMRRAVAADFAAVEGVQVLMTLDARLPDEPGPWTIRRVGRDDPPSVQAILPDSVDAVVLIAPETQSILARLATAVEELGDQSLGSWAYTIRMVTTKTWTDLRLREAGLCMPPVRLVADWIESPGGPIFTQIVRRDDPTVPKWPFPAAWDRGPFHQPTEHEARLAQDHEMATLRWSGPLVVKPDDGAGCVGTYFIADPSTASWDHHKQRPGRLATPYVAGTPMSASFLVDRDGTPHLVGVGRQHVEVREDQFHYLGGTVPAGTPEMADEARRAIDAIPGLRGWVGVDFIWEPTGRAVILEINPRLTTSYVGLRRLLPPGELARAWLAAFENPRALAEMDLARRVHAQAPVCFGKDGTVPAGDESAMRSDQSPAWLGLDIGGANLKVAHSLGASRVVPFPVWKQPRELPRALADLVGSLPPATQYAVTMTAELCDCFATRAEGVRAVLSAVTSVVPADAVRVWGLDGAFHPPDEIHERPALAAASNWLALATVAAQIVPEGAGLLIDVGSTTTDLIPLKDGRPVPVGRTDTDRLQTGELVYAGVGRTPLSALATHLPWRGVSTGLAAEFFATTLDVYLTLRDIPEDPENREATADGRPRTIANAQARLARMIGADTDTFSAEDAISFARAADQVLLDRIILSCQNLNNRTDPPRGIVISGSGEFLARRIAGRVIAAEGKIVSLSERWGPVASAAACAQALIRLAPGREGMSAHGDESAISAPDHREDRREPADLV